jgi:cation:H+ antiporter
MVLIYIAYIIIGLLLLVKGGDYLIDGSVAIAKRAKLSSMVIGITVIGFGTSMPELLVSTQAALIGSPGLAIGNVVGSNIADIALILGVTAIICPLTADKMALVRDLPFMMLAVILLVIVGMSGTIYRWEGLFFVTLLFAYVAYQIRASRKKEKLKAEEETAEQEQPVMPLWKSSLTVILSIAALIAGANLLIKGASDIAMTLGTALGVEVASMERIIGLTIVAVGTSLPELTATVMAARKRQADLALGNIIGSVSFNILCVVGVASAVCPIYNADRGFFFDYMFMLGLAPLLWFFLYTERKLVRSEGWILTMLYVLYIARTLLIV